MYSKITQSPSNVHVSQLLRDMSGYVCAMEIVIAHTLVESYVETKLVSAFINMYASYSVSY